MLKLKATLSKLKLIIFVVVLIYLLVLNGQSFFYNRILEEQVQKLRTHLFAVQKRRKILLNKKLMLGTKAVMEISARERLGLIKEGEVAVKILNEN